MAIPVDQQDSKYIKTLKRIPVLGIILSVTSGLFFSIGSLIVKMVEFSPLQMLVARSAVQLVVFGFVVLTCRITIGAKGERLLLLGRCIAGFVNLLTAYTAVKLLPLGDATVITYTSVVFVVVFAWVFFKEPWTYLQVFTVGTCMLGAFMVTRPTFIFGQIEPEHSKHFKRLEGNLYALGNSLANASISILLRKLQKTPSTVVVFWLSFFVTFLGLIIQFFTSTFIEIRTTKEVVVLILFGLANCMAQYCMTLAFKLEDAGPVALARTSTIVFAFIFQITIVREKVFWTSIVGGLTILGSVFAVGLEQWYYKRPEFFLRLFPFLRSKQTLTKQSADSMEPEGAISDLKTGPTAKATPLEPFGKLRHSHDLDGKMVPLVVTTIDKKVEPEIEPKSDVNKEGQDKDSTRAKFIEGLELDTEAVTHDLI